MNIEFTAHAWEEYHYWRNNDKALFNRINKLIQEIQRTPFEGTGKPEPLRHTLSGFWSRRITDEHRIVYAVTDTSIRIIQLRYHY